MKGFGYLLTLLAFVSLPSVGWAQRRDDAIQFFEDIEVGEEETVGDAVCIGCSVRVRGTVGHVVAVGGAVQVSGVVSGDAVAIGGTIRLEPGSKLEGDALAILGRVEKDPEAGIGGEITSLPGPNLTVVFLWMALAIAVFSLVLVLVTYLITGSKRVEVEAATLGEHAGLGLLTGLVLTTVIVISLVVSALMWPLTPFIVVLIGLALTITLLVGYTGVSLWIGRMLLRDSRPLLATLLGAVLITVLQLIPILGFLPFLVFFLLALGSASLSGYGSATNWLFGRFPARHAVPPASPPAVR